MKPLLVSFLLLSCFNLKSQEKYHYIDPDSLTWNDYTGQPNTLRNSTACTSSAIRLSYKRKRDSISDLNIWVVFMYDSCYIKYDILFMLPYYNRYLLFNHEKNHYLITIIAAKNLLKYISNNPKLSDQEVDNLLDNSTEKAKIFQELYDIETDNSLNQIEQLQWSISITNQLNRLKGYNLSEPK